MDMLVVVIIAVGALVGFFFFVRSLLPQCPACQSRAGFRYDHQRTNGGPGRRYRSNRMRCVNCGVVVA